MPKWICPGCKTKISYMRRDKEPTKCSVCGLDLKKKGGKAKTIIDEIDNLSKKDASDLTKSRWNKKTTKIKNNDENGFGTNLEAMQ